jgi:ubiquinone biosynthesis protein COQ9
MNSTQDPAGPDATGDSTARLVTAAFQLAAEQGWSRVRVAEAARRAGIPLADARKLCPNRAALLLRFGRLADQAALAHPSGGSPRDRLFDALMLRFEFLQAHRAGVVALLAALPTEPPTTLLLAAATHRSMAWMLEAAEISTAGLAGRLRVHGLVGVWLWTLRTWQNDMSDDLSSTMAALDKTLERAERAAGWLQRRPGAMPAGPAADLAPEPDLPPEPELPMAPPESPPEPPASAPDII